MQYHGRIRFPAEYPFKPPAILMHTPNGRFKTDERLCLSMSDYHPETWNPMWSVSTVRSPQPNQLRTPYHARNACSIQRMRDTSHAYPGHAQAESTHKRTRRLANIPRLPNFYSTIGRLQSSAVRLRCHARSGGIGSACRDLVAHANL